MSISVVSITCLLGHQFGVKCAIGSEKSFSMVTMVLVIMLPCTMIASWLWVLWHYHGKNHGNHHFPIYDHNIATDIPLIFWVPYISVTMVTWWLLLWYCFLRVCLNLLKSVKMFAPPKRNCDKHCYLLLVVIKVWIDYWSIFCSRFFLWRSISLDEDVSHRPIGRETMRSIANSWKKSNSTWHWMNKEKLTRVGFEPATSGLTYQLSELALYWVSPYFVNIFVRGGTILPFSQGSCPSYDTTWEEAVGDAPWGGYDFFSINIM